MKNEETLLFSDDMRNDRVALKKLKTGRIIAMIAIILFGFIFMALLIQLFFTPEEEILPMIFVMIMVLLLLMIFILFRYDYSDSRCGYLFIYKDRIIVKPYGKKEMIFNIMPREYSIILKRNYNRTKFSTILIFQENLGKIMFIYKSISLYPSVYQSVSYQWEKDIFRIGCNVVDTTEVIKNV